MNRIAAFPRRFEPALFGLILSGLMSWVVSGISTFRAIGLDSALVSAWTGAWLAAWAVAFPLVLVIAPLTRRFVQRLVAPR